MDDETRRILEDHDSRLKRVEVSTGEFQTFREVINVKLDAITQNLSELKDAVIMLKSKPAALWEKVVSAIVGAAATGFIAYLIGR